MEEVFKGNRRLAACQGLRWGIRLWAAGAIAYGLLVWQVNDIFGPIWLLIALAAAVVIGPVAGALRNVMVVSIDENEVVISRGKNREERFLLAKNDFGTIVENRTVFGFVYDIKRYLKINNRLHPCFSFSRRGFSQMSARIQQQKSEAVDNAEKEYPIQEIYLIPQSELLQNGHRNILKVALESLGVAVILLIAWCVGSLRRMEPVVSVWLIVAAVLVGILLFIPIVVEIFRYRKYKKELPEKIIIQEASLKVDEQEFNFSEIELIWMTPASYPRAGQYSVKRNFTIVCKNGTFEYLLGHTQIRKLQYREYERLLAAIEETCRLHQITFVLEL